MFTKQQFSLLMKTVYAQVGIISPSDISLLITYFRYVEIDEKDEEGNKKVFEEGVAVNDNLEVLYVKQGRHSMTSTSSGSNGVDYILKIQSSNILITALFRKTKVF